MITKNYIKMCEQAEEIQKAWKPKVGDRRIDKRDRSEGFIESQGVDYIRSKSDLKIINIWLPTQEQLQEIIHITDWHGVLVAFLWWWGEGVDIEEITSMNELWLTFVMHEKYNKTWDGKKWKA